MGVSFDAVLFFGMVVEGGCSYDLMEKFNEANTDLELIWLSPMTSDECAIMVKKSYHSADKNSDQMLIRLEDVSGGELEWLKWIIAACEAHGIKYSKPDWCFMTRFW